MSSIFDFIFQGSPPPSVTTSTQTQQGFPDWYQELMRANIGQAISATGQPYQAFPGQQVANQTAPTLQAYQMTQQNVGSADPSLNAASGALGQVASGFNENEFNKYLSPFTSGITDNIATLGARNLSENLLPAVNDTFTGSGQFGSTRHGDFTARAVRDTNQSILQQQNSALQQAFQNAMSGYTQGNQNQIAAGTQLGALGQIYQNTGLKDAAAMGAIGQEQQAQNQQNLNVGYQNWQNQTAYPYNNIAFLNSVIRGLPAPTTSTGTSIAPMSTYQAGQASPASQAAGIGGLGALAQSYVASTPNFFQ